MKRIIFLFCILLFLESKSISAQEMDIWERGVDVTLLLKYRWDSLYYQVKDSSYIRLKRHKYYKINKEKAYIKIDNKTSVIPENFHKILQDSVLKKVPYLNTSIRIFPIFIISKTGIIKYVGFRQGTTDKSFLFQIQKLCYNLPRFNVPMYKNRAVNYIHFGPFVDNKYD